MSLSKKNWPESDRENARTVNEFPLMKKTKYLFELVKVLYPVDRIECHTEWDDSPMFGSGMPALRYHVFVYYTNGKGEHTWDTLLNVGFGDLCPGPGHILLDHMLTHEEMIDYAIYNAKKELASRKREWDKAVAHAETAIPK